MDRTVYELGVRGKQPSGKILHFSDRRYRQSCESVA